MLRVAVYRLVPASLFPISSTVHSTDKRQVKYHVLYTVLIILCTVKGRFLCYHKNVVLFSQKPTYLLSDNCFGLPTSYPAEIEKCIFQDLSGAFDVREHARFGILMSPLLVACNLFTPRDSCTFSAHSRSSVRRQ